MLRSLVGSEMCIRDRYQRRVRGVSLGGMSAAPPEGQPPAAAQDSGRLELKPFGKHGVRILWQRAGAIGVLRAEYLSGESWVFYGEVGDDDDGVEVVRDLPHHPELLPRSVGWRLRSDHGCTSLECVSSRPGRAEIPPNVQILDNVEMVWNILQWYSTMVVDCREGNSLHRLPGSLICPSEGSIPGVGFRDNALCIECPPEVLALVHKRLFGRMYQLPLSVLERLASEHGYLFSDIHLRTPSARGWPNLIGDRVLLGHQGHASSLGEYAEQLRVAGVVNMAGDKVVSSAGALPETMRENYVEIRHADGDPLTDGVGDRERFLEVLPAAIVAIERAAESGRALVHCQQGRSRSAAVVVGWLLVREPAWDLFQAVVFTADRRPEVQINIEYLEGLEQWATEVMARQGSLDLSLIHI
eukprot:TRINITY_DN43836_c0_g1_i1.p1 TRINITY_DN43836_c0_g1~~TRINITY_DN43836_c0_g1_i1.p1  ORF type:complete len:414 (+),score=69.85 TRINITY_DN43836_c0_g1_i1:138-1379(+)